MGLMNADHLAAFLTGPLFSFLSYETSNPKTADHRQVVGHTHAVLSSIPFVQPLQPAARNGITACAEPLSGVRHLLAVLDRTQQPGFRLEIIRTSASRTG